MAARGGIRPRFQADFESGLLPGTKLSVAVEGWSGAAMKVLRKWVPWEPENFQELAKNLWKIANLEQMFQSERKYLIKKFVQNDIKIKIFFDYSGFGDGPLEAGKFLQRFT